MATVNSEIEENTVENGSLIFEKMIKSFISEVSHRARTRMREKRQEPRSWPSSPDHERNDHLNKLMRFDQRESAIVMQDPFLNIYYKTPNEDLTEPFVNEVKAEPIVVDSVVKTETFIPDNKELKPAETEATVAAKEQMPKETLEKPIISEAEDLKTVSLKLIERQEEKPKRKLLFIKRKNYVRSRSKSRSPPYYLSTDEEAEILKHGSESVSFINGNRNDSNLPSSKTDRRVENKENEPRKRDEVNKRNSRDRIRSTDDNDSTANSCLAVFNLSIKTTETSFYDYWRSYGRIKFVKIVRNNGRWPPYGFVSFEDARDAWSVYRQVENPVIDGASEIRIKWAFNNPNHPKRSRFNSDFDKKTTYKRRN